MKKTIYFMLSLMVIIILSLNAAFAYDVPDYIDINDSETLMKWIEKEVRSEYSGDTQFEMMKSEYGRAYAEEMIQDVINGRYEKIIEGPTRAQYYSWYYCDIPNIEQSETFYCGHACVLQTLYGLDLEDDVTGATDADKQYTLADDMDATTHGAYVYKVRDCLNSYLGSSLYVYSQGSTKSISEFETDLKESLKDDYPVILHTYTGEFDYYGTVDVGHYISANGIDVANDEVSLSDPHYSSTYFGDHTVELQEAYYASSRTSPTARYYIYVE